MGFSPESNKTLNPESADEKLEQFSISDLKPGRAARIVVEHNNDSTLRYLYLTLVKNTEGRIIVCEEISGGGRKRHLVGELVVEPGTEDEVNTSSQFVKGDVVNLVANEGDMITTTVGF